jgi:hypothetical protein
MKSQAALPQETPLIAAVRLGNETVTRLLLDMAEPTLDQRDGVSAITHRL